MSRWQINMHTINIKRAAFIGLLLLCLSFQHARAEDDYVITGHFLLPIKTKPGKYGEAVQWQITNIPDWTSFVNGLSNLPKTGEGDDITSPMSENVPNIIHFKQSNPDKISGNDIYLTQKGIQQFARIPSDQYYFKNTEFRKFLDAELKNRPGYGSTTQQKARIYDPGIVVVFRGSSMLQNPMWVVKDAEEMKKYLDFIHNLQPLPDGQGLRSEVGKTIYDDVGTFLMYLNYPGASSHILSVTQEGGIRGTTVKLRAYAYQDTKGFYELFKKQAENVITRRESEEQGTNLSDKTDAF